MRASCSGSLDVVPSNVTGNGTLPFVVDAMILAVGAWLPTVCPVTITGVEFVLVAPWLSVTVRVAL